VSTALAFFNNKGGVGKTTLACNFAAYAADEGQNVLIIDLDPQCNSTQLVLSDDQWVDIYDDVEASDAATIMVALAAIRRGDSTVQVDDLPIVATGRFGADLLPGHPSLSLMEDILARSWSEFRAGTVGGARRAVWLHTLCTGLADRYDLFVVDLSPSLGALNRSALISSDHFLTPMAADLFSLYALDNIASSLTRWLKEYEAAYRSVEPELDATGSRDALLETLPVHAGFIGYTVQQYVSRSSGGEIRTVQAYERHRNEIPDRAAGLAALSPYSRDELQLGTVPNMFSMIPLAQSQHAPIASLRREDGLRGGQFSQQEKYAEQLAGIFHTMLGRVTD
jgi:cellulose biosynthesis protein BcsQ